MWRRALGYPAPLTSLLTTKGCAIRQQQLHLEFMDLEAAMAAIQHRSRDLSLGLWCRRNLTDQPDR